MKIRAINKMLFTNNARKMAGIPLRRKKNKKKRYYTRNRAEEDTEAFIDYCNGKWEKQANKHFADLSAVRDKDERGTL